MDLKLIITGDGSHSLFSSLFNDGYHSNFGAIQESKHIFIEPGFKMIDKSENPVNILEIGFGTGLNALLTFVEAKKSGKKVNYYSIEAYPIPESIYKQLNYSTFVDDSEKDILLKMHDSEWEQETLLSEDFSLLKIKSKLEETEFIDNEFDLVYFDAFAPDAQAEMWTQNIFDKIYNSMINKGILMTYSAKGEVRRRLKNSGFKVEKLPGPEGKREITRATK